MTLTPTESSRLRLQLLAEISKDSAVEFDARFVRPIFGSDELLRQWARRWDLTIERYIRAGMFNPDRTPIQWITLTKPQADVLVIFNDKDL